MDGDRKENHFTGKSGFLDYFSRHYHVTNDPCHTVLRDVLYSHYTDYCVHNAYPIAAIINIGRYLGNMGVHAKVRVGGSKGTGQKYAYAGLTLGCKPECTSSDQNPLSLGALDIPSSSHMDSDSSDTQSSHSSNSRTQIRRSSRPRQPLNSSNKDYHCSSNKDLSSPEMDSPSDKDSPFSESDDPSYTPDQDLASSPDQDLASSPDQDLASSPDQDLASSPDHNSHPSIPDDVDYFPPNKYVRSSSPENLPSTSHQDPLPFRSQDSGVIPSNDSLSFLTQSIFSFAAGNPIFSLSQRSYMSLAKAKSKRKKKQKFNGDKKNMMEFVQQHYKVTKKTKHRIPREKLYDHYKEYCTTNNYPVLSQYTISRFLGKQGVRPNAYKDGKRSYVGLKSMSQPESDDDDDDDDSPSSPMSEPDLSSVSTLPLPDPYFSLVTQPLHGVFFHSQPLCPPDSVYRYITLL